MIPPGVYHCPPDVFHVRDDAWLIVIGGGCVHRLNGLAAAVWAWLALGHPYDRLMALTAAALPDEDDPATRATAVVNALLACWVAQGLLRRVEEAAGG